MLSENVVLPPSTDLDRRALPRRSLTESFLEHWPRPRRRLARALAYYGGGAALSVIILICLIGRWQVDLTIPFSYGGDGVFTQMWVQGLIENGWYLRHPRLGAPGELDLAAFPMADGMHFAILKVITFLVPRPGIACNLYYLLTYPLATLAALFALRRLGVTGAAALVCSLLFSFLPYHYLRGTGHLFLAAYYHVPLLVLLAIRVYEGQSPFHVDGEHGASSPRWSWRSWPAVGAIAVCLLAGSGGVYYAFFTCFFLLVAGACAAWRMRRFQPLTGSLALAAFVSLTVLVNVAPFIIDRWQHGVNECAVQRLPAHAENHGLKIAQLLLPVTGHRVSALRAFKDRYNTPATPLVNENDSATLGCVAGVGFLLLIIGLFARPRSVASGDVWSGLSVLNLSAVLLGTIGGFSSLLSFLFIPWIRGYNRVSVFIAFFALALVALALSRLQDRLATTARRRALYYGGLAMLLGLGLFDQTNRGFAQVQHETTRRDFAEDAEFVARIESALPQGSTIFELPYLPFPEVAPPRPMADYDPFRPYFHSTALRWSFGTVKGTYADAWQQSVVRKPLKEMVDTLALAGFGGIYIDRRGYGDRAAELESRLHELVDYPPLCSSSGRFAFYDLGPHREKLKQTCTDWERCQQDARALLLVTWPRGGELSEADGCKDWRWSRDNAVCLVHNPTNRAKTGALEMTLECRSPRPCQLRLDGELIREELSISGGPIHFRWRITIPPGQHAIRFHCNGHPGLSSRDLRLVEIDPHAQPGD